MDPNTQRLLVAAAQAGGGGGGGDSGPGYKVSRSLRFNSVDTARLSRAGVSTGNQAVWTFSAWVKLSKISSVGSLFTSGADSSSFARLYFGSTGSIGFNGSNADVTTTAVYRDVGAWYHVVLAINTNEAGPENRTRIYVNGAPSALSLYTPASGLIGNTGTFYIGDDFNGNRLNGYLADIHFIDGQALTPSSFGELDTNGVWQPKAYTGTYGTNGFHLDFSDNTGVTATTLGKDTSGNNNHFTPANLSVTPGPDNDSLTDTPSSYGTDTGLGGEVRGNYCTLNPLTNSGNVTLANGNLDFTSGGTSGGQSSKTYGTFLLRTGKWYWEASIASGQTAGTRIGPVDAQGRAAPLATTVASTVGVVRGFRFDADAGTYEYTDDGSSWAPSFSSLGQYEWIILLEKAVDAPTGATSVNFGQRPFTYKAPAGYKCLCSTNLPTPAIANGATAMNTVLYTGTGATLAPTSSMLFRPDLVWIKSRSAVTDHVVYDRVRGPQTGIRPNQLFAASTSDNGVTAFNSNGFSLGDLSLVNTNNSTYAAWCWYKGATAGFDIASYSGTGVNRTIIHSLNTAPELIIIKQVNSSSAAGWPVWHKSIANTEYLLLNAASGKATDASFWNSTSPASQTFSLGTNGDLNAYSQSYIAYLWTSVPGFSAFGSYTGNGVADGPFIYTGFRPQWILIKKLNSTGSWCIFDARRSDGGGNEVTRYLTANTNVQEAVGLPLDITSNGFKLRSNSTTFNQGSQPYIYAAFAEHPFKYARAR